MIRCSIFLMYNIVQHHAALPESRALFPIPRWPLWSRLSNAHLAPTDPRQAAGPAQAERDCKPCCRQSSSRPRVQGQHLQHSILCQLQLGPEGD